MFAIGEILDQVHVDCKTKVVGLTSLNISNLDDDNKHLKNKKSKLPLGLKLHLIKCTQKHKDFYFYAYLVTTARLIFPNSIVSVKRVESTLQMLHLPLKMLHANMSQKSRLKPF